ncbi:MAG: thermonuclease family protein [Vallitaleaceae bacterium]|nr:thermonuclease family protein [Vallitaleaceae bacterium]
MVEQKYEYNLNPFYRYKGFVSRVVDGDTVDAILDLGFGIAVSQRLRIDDFDAPESWRPRNEAEKEHGEAAKARAKELLEGEEVLFTTSKAIGIYGRYGASIQLADGRSYKDIMISEGLVKRDEY